MSYLIFDWRCFLSNVPCSPKINLISFCSSFFSSYVWYLKTTTKMAKEFNPWWGLHLCRVSWSRSVDQAFAVVCSTSNPFDLTLKCARGWWVPWVGIEPPTYPLWPDSEMRQGVVGEARKPVFCQLMVGKALLSYINTPDIIFTSLTRRLAGDMDILFRARKA